MDMAVEGTAVQLHGRVSTWGECGGSWGGSSSFRWSGPTGLVKVLLWLCLTLGLASGLCHLWAAWQPRLVTHTSCGHPEFQGEPLQLLPGENEL